MYRERHVKIPHVLIGLPGFCSHLKELGYILSFTIQLRDAGLDLPLIALGVGVGGDAGDLNWIYFRKVVGVHREAISDTTGVIKGDRQRTIDCSATWNGPHVTTPFTALADESGPYLLEGKWSDWSAAVWTAAWHWVAQVDE